MARLGYVWLESWQKLPGSGSTSKRPILIVSGGDRRPAGKLPARLNQTGP
jgi:hypothetical protein